MTHGHNIPPIGFLRTLPIHAMQVDGLSLLHVLLLPLYRAFFSLCTI